tara:strand:- start:536 stop:715 length:180 start_codon:yes stop_codon:yes gene_type:complete
MRFEMEDNSFLVYDMVEVDGMVGEIMKKSLTADGEYTYFVYEEESGRCTWAGAEDLILA